MSLPRYLAYRDSGIPWVDAVPAHWPVLPLFGVACERSESNAGMVEDNLLSLSYGRIVRKDIDSNDGLLPESFETYQVVHEGDIVLRLTDLQNDKRSLRSASVHEHGIITSAYLALRPEGAEPAFLSYLLRAYDLSKVFYSMGGGLRQSMKFSDLKRMPVPVPPASEQTAIATFLDRETAKIDALIDEQEKLIALLGEKRQATISHAVIRGLNPNAPMKDSGVPWLGAVPAHWRVVRLKFLLEELTDFTANGSFASLAENVHYLDEGPSRLVRLTDLRENLENDGIYVSEYAHKFLSKSALFGGEVLIANVGAYAGYACLMPSTGQVATLGPNMYLMRFDHGVTTNAYINLCLSSQGLREQLTVAATSTAQPKLNKDDVKGCVLPLPPLQEQHLILSSLSAQTSRLDQLIQTATDGIALLAERRSALIAAAVTGQIDVRGLVPV
jgi:type I restriction enzyme S subunit